MLWLPMYTHPHFSTRFPVAVLRRYDAMRVITLEWSTKLDRFGLNSLGQTSWKSCRGKNPAFQFFSDRSNTGAPWLCRALAIVSCDGNKIFNEGTCRRLGADDVVAVVE